MQDEKTVQETNKKNCLNCGMEMPQNAVFCGNCGAAMNGEANPLQNTSLRVKKKIPKKFKYALIGIVLFIISVLIISNIHFHKWESATCVQPKVCSECKKIKGEPLGHKWIEASCTEAKSCSVCQETEGDALGHSVDKWITVSEATCSKAGEQQGDCTLCAKTIVEEIQKKEHKAGEWIIKKEATLEEDGEKTLSCTVCGDVIETEKIEIPATERKRLYIDKCERYSYSAISRNPGDYDGRYAAFTGEVIQVQQDTLYGIMMYSLRVNVTWNGRYYDDTIYVTYFASEDDPRILEDDIIVMYGKLTGEKTYTTVMGNSITIPSFSAEYIDFK